MVAAVPVQQTYTLHSYTPDLFAWLAIAGLTVLIVVALVQGRRVKRPVAEVYAHSPDFEFLSQC